MKARVLLGFAIVLPAMLSTAQAAVTDSASRLGPGSAPNGQPLDPVTPVVQLSASSDAKNATLSATFPVGLPNSNATQTGFLTLTAQSPVGQGQNYANVTSLDGLAKATSLQFSFSYLNGLLAPKGKTGLAPLWIITANGKIGYETHTYYDATSLAKNTLQKMPYQVGLNVGYVFRLSAKENYLSWSLNGAANYQQAYQDNGASQTECKTTTAPIQSCVTGFIGAPTKAPKELLGFDLRHIGSIFNYSYGIDPGVTYDAKAKTEAVQVPVYLLSDASHNLTGGIRYDWTSNKHVSTLGLFVSAAFSVGTAGP